jgi:hypothetical protein
MKPSSNPVLPDVGRSFLRTALVRLVMAVVLAVSVWLALWSYFKRFQPAALGYARKTAENARLVSEVQRLELNWNALEAARTETQFTGARAQLVCGPEAMAGWEQQIEREALNLALTATLRLNPPQPYMVKEARLTNVLAVVDLQPAAIAGTTNGPYHRLLGFIRRLQDSATRVDLVALEASGRSNSVEHARAVLQLWSGEEGKP